MESLRLECHAIGIDANPLACLISHAKTTLLNEEEVENLKNLAEEIGSHRKYSRKGENAATVDTFRGELFTILSWLSHTLKRDRYACFVIGDSTIKGQRIQNDQLLIEVAEAVGYQVEANLTRHLQASKKSFNPAIGRIKDEHIVILRNAGHRRGR